MQLTKMLVPAAIACAILSGQALAVDIIPPAASDNTVTFAGQVSDSTCVMSINGQKVKPIVLLPTVPVSDFGATGSKTGTTDFIVSVSDCTLYEPAPARAMADGKTVSTVFVAHEVEDTHLQNTMTSASGGAKNIHINIMDTLDRDINFSEPFHGHNDLKIKGNIATATYKAQYVSHAPADEVSSGYVRASMQYALSYD